MQAKNVIDKFDNSNIVGLGSIAKEEKKYDKEVINSTTGMLYDEEGKLFTYNSVNKAITTLNNEERFAYFPTGGNKPYEDTVKKWLFGKYYDEIKDISALIPTPGGTGALSLSFTNFIAEDDFCLLPNHMWTNYKQILFEANKKWIEYEMFTEDGSYNLKALKEAAEKVLAMKKRVMILINDPAQNPTGYSLRDDETDELINIINELSKKGEVSLVLDLAYIDYADTYEVTRNRLAKYLRLNEEVMQLLCFSASKAFGLYGLRVGALIPLCKNKEALKTAYEACVFSARAKWSNTSSVGINLIIKILNNDELKAEYLKELNDSRLMLKKRSDLFKKLVKELGVKVLPYDAGFFVSVPTDNPKELYEKLRKNKLHIVPFEISIRITLSSVTIDEVARIPKLLKEAM